MAFIGQAFSVCLYGLHATKYVNSMQTWSYNSQDGLCVGAPVGLESLATN